MNIRKQKKKAKKFLISKKGAEGLRITKYFGKDVFVLELSSRSCYVFHKNFIEFIYHEFVSNGGEIDEKYDYQKESYNLKFKKIKRYNKQTYCTTQTNDDLPF